MIDRNETTDGFNVLDGAALVTGAAIASIHIRGVIRDDLAAPGWALIWGTFLWVAITAAGPFLYLSRRFLRRLPDYPKVGDTLWGVLGLPWLLTAILRSAVPAAGLDPAARVATPHDDPLFANGLGLTLAAASMIVMTVVWKRWVMVPPEIAAETASPPWTNRVGLFLSVTWPIQCGLGLVMID
jgi:hypothetical protein